MGGTVQRGGALSLRGSGTAATLEGCTFTGNSDGDSIYGDDIYIDNSASLTVTDLSGDSGVNEYQLDTYPSLPTYSPEEPTCRPYTDVVVEV